METKSQIHPDDLLVGIGKSIMGKALLYSIIGHFVFTGLTSISLFKDWAYTETVKQGDGTETVMRPYFLRSPSYINGGVGAVTNLFVPWVYQKYGFDGTDSKIDAVDANPIFLLSRTKRVFKEHAFIIA